ncbi:MAG: response regulator [Betaproteobacteria bacterium]|nr:response regulator [Betaproteobacteria bacterium]
MDINDLIAVLRGEIEQVQKDLTATLDSISQTPDGDLLLADHLQTYATLLERISEASGVIGLRGLARATDILRNSIYVLAPMSREERAQAIPHFSGWPVRVLAYLDDPGNFGHAEALVAHLSDGPQPLAPEEGIELMEALAAPPEIPAELLQHADPERQRIATPEDVVLDIPADVDANVYSAFIDDAPQQVAHLGELMQAFARQEARTEDIKQAKRIAHTFKGTASIVGIRGIATIAHHAEDLLEFLEERPAFAPADLSRTLVDAAACLDQMVYALLGQEEPPRDAQAVLQRLLDWANRIDSGEIEDLDDEAAAPEEDANRSPPAELPRDAASATPARSEAMRGNAPLTEATFRVPVSTVDEILRLVGDLATRLGDAEERIAGLGERGRELLTRQQTVQRRLEEIEDMVDLRGAAVQRQAARAAPGEFDPLELDRYNELHGSTHALMEEATDVREITLAINEALQAIAGTLHGQHYAHRELQHLVLATRLAPASSLAPRLSRNVRQTCQVTGKEAELVIEGADVAIDTDVLNQLADPLLHVLRNAIDHGIESPDERIAAGKPPGGIITLSFARQGEGVTVRCTDDGRGLNLEKIHTKAVERGLIEPGKNLSDAEVAQLILLPGFSTRDQVSEISGRGVGLDVVAERVKSMKGLVSISSTEGAGTAIEMRVQASLAMVHSIVLEVAGNSYAIPSQHVEFVLSAGHAKPGGDLLAEPMIIAREQLCSARRLGDLIFGAQEPLTADIAVAQPSVVIRSGDELIAVVVDKVHDARNLVLKSAGRYLGLLRGLAGVSVAHNGRVLPLLDLPDLLADQELVRLASEARAALGRQVIERKSVLIVDDSLSVRRMLRELVEDAGFDPITAKDGAEAWELLQTTNPNLMLTDLEMPNLNGLELTARVRSAPDLAQFPIIMITSRSMEKHRRQAADAGVNVYVTKPYSDVDLLRHIREAMEG